MYVHLDILEYCILLSYKEDNYQSINVHYLNIQHYFKQDFFHLIYFALSNLFNGFFIEKSQ